MVRRALSIRARQLLWFVSLWGMGVLTVATFAYLIRLALVS